MTPAAVVPSVHDFGGYLLPLIQRLAEISGRDGKGGLFLFTSAAPREGVSWTVQAAARELTRLSPDKVLVLGGRGLPRLSPAQLRASHDVFQPVGQSVLTVRQDALLPYETAAYRFEECLDLFRRWFRFTLIDCPSLEESALALALTPHTDGSVLVVAAGSTDQSRIIRSRDLLSQSKAPLLGCVLNRRTYPIPSWIYKRL